MDDTKLKPALIGGAVFGVLSQLPYVQMANIACCALYIGGGLLASYLFFKGREPFAKPYGEGASVGLWTGVFGGIVAGTVGALKVLLGPGESAEETAATMEAFESIGTEVPPWVLQILGVGEVTGWSIVLPAVLAVVLFCIFGTVGGLLGATFFHEKDE